MKNLIKKLIKSVNAINIPLEPLPPKLILSGALKRSGLSAEKMASEILSRQSDAGAPFGEVFNGTNNIAEAMEVIRCQVIVEELIKNAKIEIVIPPGVPVRTVGANSGGPVVSNGVTTAIASGYGVMR